MAGHSKWAQIKHKKAKTDAQRGRIFGKLARAITVAAREGGGNSDMNASLANAIEKAKSYNMPADNIERAIKKGTGELGGAAYESIMYEGFGPAGVALMVDIMTDNRNRSASDIRHIFSKYNGNLGASGSVAWMFDRKGIITVSKSSPIGEEELFSLAVDAGAEDMKSEDDQWMVTTDPAELHHVREVITKHGIGIGAAEIAMIPKTQVKLEKEDALKVLKLVDALEDHDDVQDVFANFDIPSEVLEELSES